MSTMSASDKNSLETFSMSPAVSTKLESVESQTSSHKEKHSNHSHIISDIIIGFADGLTVPFALTAGLSSVGSLNLVILGGLAELFAGAISMGLGAYLAAVTEHKHYLVEQEREYREVDIAPKEEEQEIYDIMAEYGLNREAVQPMVKGLMVNKDMWVKVYFLALGHPHEQANSKTSL